MANSATLSAVVGAGTGELTFDRLIEASKAYTVANQVLENMIALANPRVFGYEDLVEEGGCLKAMRADVP